MKTNKGGLCVCVCVHLHMCVCEPKKVAIVKCNPWCHDLGDNNGAVKY